MKNIKIILTSLFVASFTISCEKEPMDESIEVIDLTAEISTHWGEVVNLIYDNEVEFPTCQHTFEAYMFNGTIHHVAFQWQGDLKSFSFNIEPIGEADRTYTVRIMGENNHIIFNESVVVKDDFWGIITNQRIIEVQVEPVYRGAAQIIGGNIGPCTPKPDSDNDGCLDENDSIVNSNMEATVMLLECESGVENRLTSVCGVMISDIIDGLEAENLPNHGMFVKEVAHLTKAWVAEGLITEVEKDAIVACAGKSK